MTALQKNHLHHLCVASIVALSLLWVTGCTTPKFSNYNKPMKQETFAKVHVGMNVQDLRKILGTPIITDQFHPNLWVYLFVEPKSLKPWQAWVTLDQNQNVKKTEVRDATIKSGVR